MTGPASAIAALVLLAAASVEQVPGRASDGRLVTVERTWRDLATQPGRRLCLTVENRDRRTAHEAAAWVELLGGAGRAMRRLSLTRLPIEPPTLLPGQSGAVCVDAPAEARGVFVRLRARWLSATPRSGAKPAPRP